MLKIGDFSKLSRNSVRMLRHYDEIGLLTPEATDAFTGYRYYTEAQLTQANRITSLKAMGFGLAEIAALLSCYENPDRLAQTLQLKCQETKQEMEAAAYRLQLLDAALKQIRKDYTMMKYDVTLKELPERYVASVRQRIPSYDQESLLWQIMMEETQNLHMQPANPCLTTAVFYDGEYKENDVDVEVTKTVRGTYADTEHVKFKTLPPVQIASATYQGRYEDITEVNVAVANWIVENGYEFNGLGFNIYYVSPHETSNPEEYVTEVCYPVKKKETASKA